jgi:hypothetical protein
MIVFHGHAFTLPDGNDGSHSLVLPVVVIMTRYVLLVAGEPNTIEDTSAVLSGLFKAPEVSTNWRPKLVKVVMEVLLGVGVIVTFWLESPRVLVSATSEAGQL